MHSGCQWRAMEIHDALRCSLVLSWGLEVLKLFGEWCSGSWDVIIDDTVTHPSLTHLDRCAQFLHSSVVNSSPATDIHNINFDFAVVSHLDGATGTPHRRPHALSLQPRVFDMPTGEFFADQGKKTSQTPGTATAIISGH